jgi:D-3-phosphoglycerate dehydrogenase
MPGRHRIFLTHDPEARVNYFGETALERLRTLGDVVERQSEHILGSEELIQGAAGCTIIVSDRTTPGYAEIFDRLPDLQTFLRVAVDIRNIDVEAASRAGVLVCQSGRSWVPAVTELILGLMIDISRGVSRANIAYKQGRAPEILTGRQLAGATAGIIGYGHLGRRMAEILAMLGMEVLVADPYVTVDRPGIRQVDKETLLAASDYVLPLAVATEETENLIGAAELARMKPSAFLINASRGNLVDEAALTQALDARTIAGAAMDVGRAPDQMPTPSLAARPDVVATPHIGGLTREAAEGQALEIVAQAAEIVAGRIPKGAVNADSARRLQAAKS